MAWSTKSGDGKSPLANWSIWSELFSRAMCGVVLCPCPWPGWGRWPRWCPCWRAPTGGHPRVGVAGERRLSTRSRVDAHHADRHADRNTLTRRPAALAVVMRHVVGAAGRRLSTGRAFRPNRRHRRARGDARTRDGVAVGDRGREGYRRWCPSGAPLLSVTFWTSRFGPRLVSAPQSVIRLESEAHHTR